MITGISFDPQDTFEVSAMDKANPCHSGHVRLVKFLGTEKHGLQQMYNEDLLGVLTDGRI